METFLLIAGLAIIVGTIYLLVRGYESRTVLLGSGLLMTLISLQPMAALDSFAESMVSPGIIQAVCSVLGFSAVLTKTGSDKHLIGLLGNALMKVRPILIPGAAIATYLINIALPSASGAAAAVGSVFIPLMVATGVHPAMASSAIMAGTFGSTLNPGTVHNARISELAGVSPVEVVSQISYMSVIAVVVIAISLAVQAKFLGEDKGYVAAEGTFGGAQEGFKVNILKALIPIIPLVILILGATVLPEISMGVPQAMLIGVIFAVLVADEPVQDVVVSFFKGMGDSFGSLVGIIIAASVFVTGLNSIGIIEMATDFMLQASGGFIKIITVIFPYLMGLVTGSGDAATVAFNEAITPMAENLGFGVIDMGGAAYLGGAFGRTMSPIAGSMIVVAQLGKVKSVDIARRTAIGTLIALVLTILIML